MRKNVLFVTLDGGGNLPPVLGLAKDISDRGYRVSFLTEPCLEDLISELGYGFISFQKHFLRTDRKEDVFKDWNSSPVNNPVLKDIVFGPSKIVAEETRMAIEQTDARLVVADILMPTALMAAESVGIPGILAFHMPEYFPGPNRPPGMFGLKPGIGFTARLRDKILTLLFNKKLNGFLPSINETRSSLDLPPLKRTIDLIHSADLRLMQTLEKFDFAMEPKPSNLRYSGPVLNDPDWVAKWDNPWSKDDPRPLVVISLSSTFQNQKAAIQSSITALEGMDVRGLVTLGPALEKENFRLPENVVVVDSAPHSRVFPLADMVISHGGHGTIMRALSWGLPLLCLPMGRDQNDNAVKVQHHGCGIGLNAKAGPEKIQKAIRKMLTQDSFKNAAAEFQKELEGTDSSSILLEIEALMTQSRVSAAVRHEKGLRYA